MRKEKKVITILAALIAVLSAVAASAGIFSDAGGGTYAYETIRGRITQIYGKGLYHHMSADVAIQGIAQDYVTLLVGVPLLLIALAYYRRGLVRGHFLLMGTLGYFLVTYLFYTAMGMYNELFLVYAALLGLSFFALVRAMLSVDLQRVEQLFADHAPTTFVGGYLIFSAIAIALLWLSVVVPPLLDGTIYPPGLEHFTTLIVQGFDLGLLLPISMVSGWLLLRRTPMGWLCGTIYIVFLSLLMTALTAKVIAMALAGQPVIPVIFVIPTFNLLAIYCAYRMLNSMRAKG